jgi:glycosyltransferase involved in cell wall biosynthesis
VHFIVNGIYCSHVSGGDIHCFQLARGLAARGWKVAWFGGSAFKGLLDKFDLPKDFTLTDRGSIPKANEAEISGQAALFWDYFKRFVRIIPRLGRIGRGDIVYAVSDYWFDVIPAVLSKARRKVMVLHMECPTFGEILRRSRPDVAANRLSSIYYWLSQNTSLRLFRWVKRKRMVYLHPAMKPRLLGLGYREEELHFVSYGLETAAAAAAQPGPKEYDVCWIGRVHIQKGVDDLLAALVELSKKLPDFKAIMIGNLEKDLGPDIDRLALRPFVQFSGFVSEEEKFRLFKASRVFLMPSRHEGSPRVIGEAVIGGITVVAYAVKNYRPLYGDFVRYVPCFDRAAFVAASVKTVEELRARPDVDTATPERAEFTRANSWEVAQNGFDRLLAGLAAEP